MTVKRHICRNFGEGESRICMKLEPEFWTMLGDICDQESMAVTTLLHMIQRRCHRGNLTSAVRVFIATYFHSIAVSIDDGESHRVFDPQGDHTEWIRHIGSTSSLLPTAPAAVTSAAADVESPHA
jgi:predicted DNA-binding ribbon-helix-helix protein